MAGGTDFKVLYLIVPSYLLLDNAFEIIQGLNHEKSKLLEIPYPRTYVNQELESGKINRLRMRLSSS